MIRVGKSAANPREDRAVGRRVSLATRPLRTVVVTSILIGGCRPQVRPAGPTRHRPVRHRATPGRRRRHRPVRRGGIPRLLEPGTRTYGRVLGRAATPPLSRAGARRINRTLHVMLPSVAEPADRPPPEPPTPDNQTSGVRFHAPTPGSPPTHDRAGVEALAVDGGLDAGFSDIGSAVSASAVGNGAGRYSRLSEPGPM